MPAPLTRSQKSYLAQLARRAFRASAPVQSDSNAWRHAETAKACGKLGLRCCSQDDYHLVKSHFEDLAGEPGRAINTFVRGATNDQRVWRYKLAQACAEAGVDMAYADAIARRQHHGTGIDQLDAASLRRLFFTVRNRRNRKPQPSAQ